MALPNSAPNNALMEGFPRNAQPLIAPVFKAGLVLLRKTQSGEFEVCLTQVKAKKGYEQNEVDYGLPKGTRMYHDKATDTWHDAKDPMMAFEHRQTLESLKETVAREGEEEIGLPADSCKKLAVKELGVRLFESRDKQKVPFEIMWYVAEADAAVQKEMGTPTDARSAAWFNLSDIKKMETENRINPHYVRVAQEAIERFKANTLTPTHFVEPKLEQSSAQPTR